MRYHGQVLWEWKKCHNQAQVLSSRDIVSVLSTVFSFPWFIMYLLGKKLYQKTFFLSFCAKAKQGFPEAKMPHTQETYTQGVGYNGWWGDRHLAPSWDTARDTCSPCASHPRKHQVTTQVVVNSDHWILGSKAFGKRTSGRKHSPSILLSPLHLSLSLSLLFKLKIKWNKRLVWDSYS